MTEFSSYFILFLKKSQIDISIERPDSLDDYCVSNALTLFRGTKILIRINFQNLRTQVKSATASVDIISVIASFWIKLENPGEVSICQTS